MGDKQGNESKIVNEIRNVKEQLKIKTGEKDASRKERDRILNENIDNPQTKRILNDLERKEERLSKEISVLEEQLRALETRLTSVRGAKQKEPSGEGREVSDERRSGQMTAAQDMQRYLKHNLEEIRNVGEEEQKVLLKSLDQEKKKMQEMEEKVESLANNVQKKLEERGKIISDGRHLIEDKLTKCRDAVGQMLNQAQAEMERDWEILEAAQGQVPLQQFGLSFSVQRDAILVLVGMVAMAVLQIFLHILFWSSAEN